MLDGPRSAGWRDHVGPGESRRRKFDFDFRDSEGHGSGRRRAGSDGLEDERDGLPEWCTDEEDSEMGTFDSTGAFMPMKVRLVHLSAFAIARLHERVHKRFSSSFNRRVAKRQSWRRSWNLRG